MTNYPKLFLHLAAGVAAAWVVASLGVRVAFAQVSAFHSSDYLEQNRRVGLSELLRLIQVFNSGSYSCAPTSEDGYAVGPGDRTCAPHSADYTPQDWQIGLSELLRVIQIYNVGEYHADPAGEDGFAAGPFPTGVMPQLVWSVEEGVKNPVTDLAGCAQSVMACVQAGTALGDCFGTRISVCSGPAPADDCCMQACGDQLAQALQSGMEEQDAFLEVFVADGSCMPGIAKEISQ